MNRSLIVRPFEVSKPCTCILLLTLSKLGMLDMPNTGRERTPITHSLVTLKYVRVLKNEYHQPHAYKLHLVTLSAKVS